jgi:hypothetical protein
LLARLSECGLGSSRAGWGEMRDRRVGCRAITFARTHSQAPRLDEWASAVPVLERPSPNRMEFTRNHSSVASLQADEAARHFKWAALQESKGTRPVVP